MRLRPHTWFARQRRRVTFAWLPKRLRNGTWVWLEPVTRLRGYEAGDPLP